MEDMNKELNQTRGEQGLIEALEACELSLAEWKEKFTRIAADFDNFKRRMEKEQAASAFAYQAEILRKLLPIVDDIDRAVTELKTKQLPAELATWFSGFHMIGIALNKFLESCGVQEIIDLKTFSPSLHEAIVLVDAPDKITGDIVQQLQKGYTLHGAVLRPAKVSVAK